MTDQSSNKTAMSPAKTEQQADQQAGFTLIEMMMALAILTFGLSSLIGVLSVGVGTRRDAEMRSRATMLAGQVFQTVQRDIISNNVVSSFVSGDEDEQDSEIEAVDVDDIFDFPGLKYRVEFKTDPENPKLVLVTVRVSWLEQGENVGHEFQRVMVREKMFSQRVASRREQR